MARVRVADERGFGDVEEMTAVERSARVTAALCSGRRLGWQELQEITGMQYNGCWRLMNKLARVLPVWYDRDSRVWMVSD